MGSISAGIGGRKDDSYLARQFADNNANGLRLLGALSGVASLFFPWGSAIYREVYVSAAIVSKSPLDLLMSNDILMIGAFLFIAFTILAFVEGWAVLGQMAGAIVIILSLSTYLTGLPIPAGLVEETKVEVIGLGLGTAMGIASIALVLGSLLINRGQRRFSESRVIRTDRRHMTDWSSFLRRQRYGRV